MPKPLHLIMYLDDANQKNRLTRLAHQLNISYSELLRLLALSTAKKAEQALRKGARPEAVLAALRKSAS